MLLESRMFQVTIHGRCLCKHPSLDLSIAGNKETLKWFLWSRKNEGEHKQKTAKSYIKKTQKQNQVYYPCEPCSFCSSSTCFFSQMFWSQDFAEKLLKLLKLGRASALAGLSGVRVGELTVCTWRTIDVSENGGTPKSSILIGFSIIIINHPFWGTPIFWKHPMVGRWIKYIFWNL